MCNMHISPPGTPRAQEGAGGERGIVLAVRGGPCSPLTAIRFAVRRGPREKGDRTVTTPRLIAVHQGSRLSGVRAALRPRDVSRAAIRDANG